MGQLVTGPPIELELDDVGEGNVPAVIEAGGRGYLLTMKDDLVPCSDRVVRLASLLVHVVSLRLPLEWRMKSGLALDSDVLDVLAHLPPPIADDEDPRVSAWRSGYRYGMLFYRGGPRYVVIHDRRARRTSNLVLDGLEAETYRRLCGQCVDCSTLSPDGRSLVEKLAARGLALVGAETAAILPYRMRRWPVPDYLV